MLNLHGHFTVKKEVLSQISKDLENASHSSKINGFPVDNFSTTNND